jgi:hypothetical protein
VTNHSRARNVEFAIVSTYRTFTEYLRDVLAEMYKHNPLLVVGKAVGKHSLSFQELVKLGTFKAIGEHIVAVTIRSLENERSTTKLLEKILDHTGTVIPQTVRDDALSHLELRHLIVHNNRRIDERYEKAYGDHLGVSVKDKVPTTFTTAEAAMRTTTTLVDRIDSGLISHNFLKAR